MEPEDLQWLWEKLAGRTDFRHLGQASWQDERVRDWSLIHPENSVPGSRSRHPPVAAPLHTVSSNEVSFHDLEDLMAALFAVQADFDDLQTNVSLGEVDGTMVDDVSPRPLRPQDIADDGWPKWMKRIDFSQSDKSPFKVRSSFTVASFIDPARYSPRRSVRTTRCASNFDPCLGVGGVLRNVSVALWAFYHDGSGRVPDLSLSEFSRTQVLSDSAGSRKSQMIMRSRRILRPSVAISLLQYLPYPTATLSLTLLPAQFEGQLRRRQKDLYVMVSNFCE